MILIVLYLEKHDELLLQNDRSGLFEFGQRKL